MNIRNSVLKTAFALAAFALPFVSRAAAGNIYEIRPVDADGNAIAAPTANLDPGEVARFTVRLLKNEALGEQFGLVYLGVGSEAVAWYANRPKIGIWVSGELRFATLESVKARNEVFTDLIFAYEVKPGDFALPIRLAGSDGSMLTPNSSTSEYYLDFRKSSSPDWDIRIGGVSGGAQANFVYATTPPFVVSPPESDGRVVDYDLAKCNFNVQTVDFDDAWDDATTKTAWRTVHQGSCEIDNGGEIPSLHVDSMPTNNAYSLYLWSSDETKFKMPEGTDCVQRDIHVTSSTSEKRWVREIKIISGKQDYTFDIEGVAQGTTADLILSPYPDFNYSDATSAILSDYVTVPVKCSEPSARAVTVAPASRTVTATSDYTHYVTELKVTFNQAFSEDVEIEIVPSIQDASCPFNWWDYIRFSSATDDDVTLQTSPDTNPTVTIRAGSTTATTRLYIYALRSDEWVNDVSNHILFTPKTTNANASQPVADGGIGGWDEVAAAGLNISAQNPSIDSVFDGTDAATAIADVDRTLRIVVTDTYADMTCTNGGYEVWIVKDKDGSDTTPVKVDGLFLPGKGGLLYLTNTTDVLPTVRYSAAKSTYTSSIYVVSPISRNESEYHDFTMTVTAPNRVVPTIVSTGSYATNGIDFAEGDPIQLKIALQDASGSEVQNSEDQFYVYIQGDDAASRQSITNCSWVAAEGGKGRPFPKYDRSISSGCTFELTDGDSSTFGKFLSYSIILLTEPTWTNDATKVVAAYKATTPVTFNVHNVIPSVDYVEINDGNYTVTTSGSSTPVATFPIDVEQKFNVLVNEPGLLDKTATGDDAFRVRWRIVDPYGSAETLTMQGNPDEMATNYTFAVAGEYTVEVSLCDKDMSGRYGNGTLNGTFTFKVSVIDRPAITLEHNGPYNETDSIDAGGEAQVTVKLGINECNFPMQVKLLIAPNATSSTAPGLFKLQENANVTANGSETLGSETYDSYTVTFPRRTLEMPIFVQSMDGTLDSKTTGFKAILTNVTETVVPNSGGKRACDYYLGQSPSPIKVYNVAPVLDESVDVYPVPGTNAFKVAIGQVDEALTWSFTDVANDFERGIKVEFKGGGGYSKTFTNSADAIAAGAEGFRPTFTSSGAGQTVRLVITDPDNGVTTVTWTYDVEAAKSMTLAAHGPATGLGGAKSDRYNSKAKGLGEGRVWAASRSSIPVSTWESTINCQLEKSFRVYGYGYKVGDVDDGTNLHYPDGRTGYYTARDTPINASGANLATGETGYTYVPRKDAFGNSVDSFLYTWLVLSTGDSSGGAVTDAYLNETTAPEYSEANDAGKTVSLPTEEDDEGGYALTQLEAVFSIEKYASDNMGDINQDGIPDIYVKKYDFGVYDANSGAVTGDDLTSLASFNDDEDYLPDGSKFTAQLEIRGYGYGLNDAPELAGLTGVKPDRVYTDPDADSKSTLSKVEYLAWLEYAAANGLNATDSSSWTNWSPECPSDPAMDDTDEDGFPDGLEYYYWYRATVGYLEVHAVNGARVTNHVYATGRRFDPKNPGEGTVITSEEIARVMNPRLASGSADEAATRDSDNDGLTDLEEMALGTNPFDFDTDGDGLPDGFEVMCSKTDPLKYATDDTTCDAERNYDGDHMAYTTLYKASAEPFCGEVAIRNAEGRPSDDIIYPVTFAVLKDDGDTDGVQWYVVHDPSLVSVTPTTVDVAAGFVTFEAYDGEGAWSDDESWAAVALPNDSVLPALDAGTVSDDAVMRLYADVEAADAFSYETDASGAIVRGIPVRLPKGTLVRNVGTATSYVENRLAAALEEKDCNAAWVYGNEDVSVGDDKTARYGELTLGRHEAVEADAVVVAEPSDTRKLSYIHSFVYQQFGFDPRTAWSSTTPLAPRWGSTTAGLSTRTRPYTTYDEFLVMSYYLNGGAITASALEPSSANSWSKIFSRYTTNPRGPNEPQADTTSDTSSVTTNAAAASAWADANGADTDGDGVPDGWELYVMSGPKEVRSTLLTSYSVFKILGPDAPMSPTNPMAGQSDTDSAMDDDSLNEQREFAGTDSVAAYTNVSTTIVRPAADANWLNKFFPTDPWNADTDGDGLEDNEEATAFAYGTPADGLVSGSYLKSIPGGGLNPCSVDTDLDGLPDGWEKQFSGSTLVDPADYAGIGDLVSYAVDASGSDVGNCLAGYSDGMDGTVADALSYPIVKSTSTTSVSNTITRTYIGPTIATVVNRDYDHDGLENWQEYLVGTMRCWRYDDPFTRWDYIPSEFYGIDPNDLVPAVQPTPDALEALGCASMDEFWYKTLVDKTSPIYNPHLVTDQSSGALYFSRVTNSWDCAFNGYYVFKDRIADTTLSDLWGATTATEMGYTNPSAGPSKYVSCDPTKADTDQDGMDDYYELFHGLNPLLGESGRRISEGGPCDIVYDAWYENNTTEQPSAKDNVWTRNDGARLATVGWKTPRGTMDFEAYPWLNGLADADPDGDDIRNQVEALMPEVATSTWLHTDPSPLWMTDSTYSNSLVRMFGRLPMRYSAVVLDGDSFTYQGTTYKFNAFDGYMVAKDAATGVTVGALGPFLPDFWSLAQVGEGNWLFSFEENEGYDTDHDGVSDYEEKDGSFRRSGSDPQDFDSPVRRQAMYFQGPEKPSLLQSLPEVVERHPVATLSYPDDMSFLQYTVECWVCPDTVDSDATILERVIWSNPSHVGDEEFLRRNFQLAVKGGKWYTCFDPNGTLADNQVEVFSQTAATAGAWTHLAATYDGKDLVLYVNGDVAGSKTSGLQPEYGSSAICVYAQKDAGTFAQTYWFDREYRYKALLIGASAKGRGDLGDDWHEHLNVLTAQGLGRYKGFYKGYVDEVRIWDGARTVDAIRETMKTRYTSALAQENRSAFYSDWADGKRRYAKDSSGADYDVEPELRYHYSFDSVPGAENDATVAKVPHGFATGAKGEGTLPSAGYEIAWWKRILSGDDGTGAYGPGYGSVYDDPSWVTWVPNTVAHLPRFDGTTLDSIYWSEDFKGDVAGTYQFAHTAEPVSRWTQMTLNRVGENPFYQTTGSRHRLVNGFGDEDGFYRLFEFTSRHLNQMGDDLLPLGGAFAKYVPASIGLWDGQGASSAWENTGLDGDNDGLPDWWQEYADSAYRWDGIPSGETVTWDTVVDYNGLKIAAWEAYLRDLAKGMYVDKDGNVQDGSGDYVQRADSAAAGVPDWWMELYGIKGESGLDDHDNDGLPNYVEYLLSEVFRLQGVAFDPTRAESAQPGVLDYFYKVGDLYVGEIFTDHDLVDDSWESVYSTDYASRLKYDPYADADLDGWSNRSENRYAKQCMPIVADEQSHYTAGDGLLADYPIPTVELTLRYDGVRRDEVSAAPLVVQTFTGANLTHGADATFNIAGAEETASSGTSSADKTSDKSVSRTRTLGGWSNRHVVGTLTPGYINKNSLALQFCYDPTVETYNWEFRYNASSAWYTARGTRKEYDAAKRKYGDSNVSLLSRGTDYVELDDVEVRSSLDSQTATWIHTKSGQVLGTVDLTSGAFDLDLGVFKDQYVVNATNSSDRVSLEDQFFRIAYSTNPSVGLPRKLYLGEADTGYVREGKNQVFVWADLNDDGVFTVGEPCGYARDVDVSWRTRAVTVELLDHSPITPRIDMLTPSGDRGKSVTDYCDNLWSIINEARITEEERELLQERLKWTTKHLWNAAELDAAALEDVRVRVIRWVVDGNPVYRYLVEPEIVLDQKMRLSNRSFLSEADFLATGALDLDWDSLKSGVVDNFNIICAEFPVTNMAYLVVIGDGRTCWDSDTDTNSVPVVLDWVIERRYTVERATPTPLNENAVVYTAQPTLKWSIAGEDRTDYTGYTAFKVKVASTDGAFSWTSDFQRMPPVGTDGAYAWNAPLFAGDRPAGATGVFENGKTYTWSVSVYNSKFRDDAFVDGGSFLMGVQTNGYETGTIRASVRYYGPAAVTNAALTRVRAYTSPDFSGDPVGSAYVTEPDADGANCRLVGLSAGTYYLQAFVDSNGNGVWDKWESMGYLCQRDGTTADYLNPISVTIGGSLGLGGVQVIYIEDADTDGDNLPDAWEYVQATPAQRTDGSFLKALGVDTLSETGAAERWMNNELVNSLLTEINANLVPTAGLMAQSALNAFRSSTSFAALAMGVSPSLFDATTGALVVNPTVTDGTLVISGFAFDAEAGEVALTVSGELEEPAVASSVYTVTVGSTVTVKVLHTATLAEDWTTVATETVTISGDSVKSGVIRVPVDVSATGGFYKVEIEQ